MTASLSLVTRTRTRCGVCGFSEVRTDEVVDRGLLLLAECPRCKHRWTESLPSPSAAGLAVVRPPLEGAATAA